MSERGTGARRVVGIVLVAVSTSSCISTMGYVPETVKPDDKATLRPSYTEVKAWASRVADGYDSRATMNRYSIYAGATLAAASVSAIAGLAAFGTGSSALIGIPIGTGFLGALAGVYQSDEKAAIYGHGARYLKSLLVLSEERIQKYDEDFNGSVRVSESEKAKEEAEARLILEQKRFKEQNDLAVEAEKVADALKSKAPDDPERLAKEKAAQSLRQLADQRQHAVVAAQAAVKAAEARVKAAQRYHELRKAAAPPVSEPPKDYPRYLFLSGEAVCLQQDVNELMAKVADHIAVLDPKDLAARLKAVKAEGKPDGGPDSGTDGGKDKGTPKPASARIPPEDLSDLALPAKSLCIY
jgi:hypothetical protein